RSRNSFVKSRHGWRVTAAIVGGFAALGVATVGGTFSSRTPERRAASDDSETIQTKSIPIAAMSKGDRLPLPVKLALAGSAS
ncbi:hypothetical protein ABTN50_20370, partial [Acinetobacter baumannii]